MVPNWLCASCRISDCDGCHQKKKMRDFREINIGENEVTRNVQHMNSVISLLYENYIKVLSLENLFQLLM